jgi:acetyl-CoA carboxylase beta subunit
MVDEADQAERRDRPILLIVFDTGGVRVEEGPAALAAVSAVGASLARLSLSGGRTISVISGPRGCFGALAVMAAVPDHVAMAANCHWGLTGPKLIGMSSSQTIQRQRAPRSFASRRSLPDRRRRSPSASPSAPS